MITNTGNSSELAHQAHTLPVWQQVAANERSMFNHRFQLHTNFTNDE
jgi:hypothetical protein